MVGLYIFMVAVAAVLAFGAQWFLSPLRRTRVIFAAALVPATLPIVGALIYGIADAIDVNWLQAIISLALLFMTFLFVALVGAIIGSELASLSRRLLRLD